jgi:vacuolar protein sorting-associated protein 3
MTHYHTSYALFLAKSALEVVHMEAKYGGKDDKENDCDVMFIYSLRERLQLFLQASDSYDPEEVLYVIAESELCLEKVMSSFIFVLVTVPYVPGLASLQ